MHRVFWCAFSCWHPTVCVRRQWPRRPSSEGGPYPLSGCIGVADAPSLGKDKRYAECCPGAPPPFSYYDSIKKAKIVYWARDRRDLIPPGLITPDSKDVDRVGRVLKQVSDGGVSCGAVLQWEGRLRMPKWDVSKTLRDALRRLEGEKSRIDRQVGAVRAALGAMNQRPHAGAKLRQPTPRRPMSAAARKAVGERMKAYWAKRRSKTASRTKGKRAA